MAVKNAFGSTGGPRGVQNQLDVGRVENRQGAGSGFAEQVGERGVAAGVATHHHHVGRVGQSGDDTVEHRDVIVPAEDLRNEDCPTVRVGEDERQFVIAQRRQDRVGDHAGQCCSQIDDRRLVPVGQREGHDAADRHSPRQGVRQDGCPVQQLSSRHNTVVVSHQDPIRCVTRAGAQRIGQCGVHPLSRTRRMVIECRKRDEGWVLTVTWATSPSDVV